MQTKEQELLSAYRERVIMLGVHFQNMCQLTGEMSCELTMMNKYFKLIQEDENKRYDEEMNND